MLVNVAPLEEIVKVSITKDIVIISQILLDIIPLYHTAVCYEFIHTETELSKKVCTINCK